MALHPYGAAASSKIYLRTPSPTNSPLPTTPTHTRTPLHPHLLHLAKFSKSPSDIPVKPKPHVTHPTPSTSTPHTPHESMSTSPTYLDKHFKPSSTPTIHQPLGSPLPYSSDFTRGTSHSLTKTTLPFPTSCHHYLTLHTTLPPRFLLSQSALTASSLSIQLQIALSLYSKNGGITLRVVL